MKSIMKSGSWGAILGLLTLSIAGLLRPGFLALQEAKGWAALLAVAVLCAALGSLVGAAFRLLLPSRPLTLGRSYIVVSLLVALSMFCGQVIRSKVLDSPSSSPWRVIVLGIDGATWDVINPLIQAGELPHMARLTEEGATGTLMSEDPTFSPRVWTTIATGLGPERHGVVDFTSTQDSLTVPRFWEVAEAEGAGIGIFGWLVTWPPGTHNGFVVPGWLARGTETWPPDLSFFQALRDGRAEREGITGLVSPAWSGFMNGVRLPTLLQAVLVKLWLKATSPDDRESTPHTLLLQSEMSTDLFVYWLHKTGPEISALVLTATDTFAHRYWRDFEPSEFGLDTPPDDGRFQDVIPEAYRQVDRTLGRLMDLAGNRTVIAVLSDHGTARIKDLDRQYSIRSEFLVEALRPLVELQAFSVTDQVFVRSADPGEDPEATSAGLAELLTSIRVDGEPLFEIEESDTGFLSVSLTRDYDLNQSAVVDGLEIPMSRLLIQSEISGGHSLDGIIGLWGPPVRSGTSIQNATLRDVAPTVLALLGYPLSLEMTGRILEEALVPAAATDLEIRYVDIYPPYEPPSVGEASNTDKEELREKLRALGYLQ